MKAKKILFVIAGVFNTVVGGVALLFGLLVLALGSLVKQMFESSKDLINEFVTQLAAEDSSYAYLTEATESEVIGFVMKIVYIMSAIAIIIGAIWIMFGVFNILLKNRHTTLFETKKYLKHLFVVGSWFFMGLNPANILTTIAVYKKNNTTPQKLYTAN